MKWSVVLAMVALLGVGVWLVLRDEEPLSLRDGAQSVELRVGTMRGALEWLESDDTFRLVLRDDSVTPEILTRAQVRQVFGQETLAALFREPPNLMFRLFNVTSWGSFAWIALGLLGQLAFFLRMMAQWIVSERRRESVVPELFWWLSFFGGIALFSYFVWRRDLIGVLGQTTGVVVYVRNLRLIHKQRRRLAAAAATATAI